MISWYEGVSYLLLAAIFVKFIYDGYFKRDRFMQKRRPK